MLNELTGFYIAHRHAVLQWAHHQKAGLFRKYNDAGKNKRLQGEWETNCEMDDSMKKPQHECTGARQGCGGRDLVGILHSQGCQEWELIHWHVTHSEICAMKPRSDRLVKIFCTVQVQVK